MVALESDVVPINISETTMDNCYDIILENEDYTMGKSLEFALYNSYYENTEIMNFCGFKKYHPHDTDSVIRVAYKDKNDKNAVKTHLINSTEKCKKVFEEIMKLF
jgi:DNA-directed RNA polymerase subunit L